jgi:spore coat polysaccharide biosynthesis protein SpsF
LNGKKQNCKVAAIVQARFGSTRLPGKILKEISNKPMLWHIVNRLFHSKLINQIIIATTTLPDDDQVQEFCETNNISFYRGSSDDVLTRYFETAKFATADVIVRITSDCPVIDPVIVDKMLEMYFEKNRSGKVDYLSNTLVRTYPRGLDTEIFSFDALERAHTEAAQQFEREHVTPYFYNHPEKFSIKNFMNEKDFSFHRWTVDTEEDFRLIEEIYKALYSKKELFLFEDILKLFEEQPHLININQNVQQKKLGE